MVAITRSSPWVTASICINMLFPCQLPHAKLIITNAAHCQYIRPLNHSSPPNTSNPTMMKVPGNWGRKIRGKTPMTIATAAWSIDKVIRNHPLSYCRIASLPSAYLIVNMLIFYIKGQYNQYIKWKFRADSQTVLACCIDNNTFAECIENEAELITGKREWR